MTQGGWVIHGERVMFAGSYISVAVADVETPTGRRIAAEVVHAATARSVAALVTNDAGQLLLVLRHHFITNTWGWELPAGEIKAGERPLDAAIREVYEKTGWELLAPRQLLRGLLCPEHSDHVGDLVEGRVGRQMAGHDVDEVAQLDWFGPDDVSQLIAAGQVVDVFSLMALFWWRAWGSHPSGGAG